LLAIGAIAGSRLQEIEGVAEPPQNLSRRQNAYPNSSQLDCQR
jgi:hypothetical protein